MTMITPSYLGETIEYSSLHACRSTLEDPTLRGFIDGSNTKMAVIDNQISSLNGKVIVGGSGIAIVVLVAQLVLNYVAEPRSSPALPTVTTAAVADNTKRVDDLIARLDMLQRSLPLSK